MSSSEKKSKFLGMPHGTATSHLRKNVLFHLLQRLDEDRCFRCGDKIDTVDELSMDHKEPWEGISIDLFWDLENIAFSHVSCNKPHRIHKLSSEELLERFEKIKHLDFERVGFLSEAARILQTHHTCVKRLLSRWEEAGLMASNAMGEQ